MFLENLSVLKIKRSTEIWIWANSEAVLEKNKLVIANFYPSVVGFDLRISKPLIVGDV